MKRKTLAFLLTVLLLTAVQQHGKAQTNPVVKVEVLKNMVALNPFKLSPDQAKSFDPSQGKGLYLEDGTTLSFEQFMQYASRPEKDYVVIPYANAADPNKVVAMLVRKATIEEQMQLKGVTEALQKRKTYSSEGSIDDPESSMAIKFDPNLKAADFLKGLKKVNQSEVAMTSINIGRVAIFDEKGNLIPLEIDGKMNPVVHKYQRSALFESDLYIDEDEVIRAMVYRKATMEERKRNGGGETRTNIREASVGGDEGSDIGGGGEMSATARLAQPGEKAAGGGKPAEFKGENASKTEKAKAFNFKATDINGKEVELSSFAGKKVVVLNFWFIQCKPCVMEMPELNKLVDEYKDNKNVEFISICLDKKEDVEKFFEKMAFKYRCIPGANSIAGKYGVVGFPTHMVVDKKGNIVLRQTSFSDDLIKDIKAEIAKGSK
ncbi:TlpA family protein disulfide reductase [Solitalea lacus]|uniref:TlpA family protein disulfide reductase n=1 Tax=Solitalea lacus TaxID=2911172 RepID=UPI001EDB03C7|nr:TlpA disulfide reductase family protein [Solitalea lacus]UKJ06566.1 TlpA family protein disulfide reductase [Solitalea lacus]